HTYAFYSVATDNVGHVQPVPAAAQAVTRVQLRFSTAVTLTSDHAAGSVYGQAVVFTATVSASDAAAGTPTGSVQFQIDGGNFGLPALLTGGHASLTVAALSAGTHTVAAAYSSDQVRFLDSTTAAPPLSHLV